MSQNKQERSQNHLEEMNNDLVIEWIDKFQQRKTLQIRCESTLPIIITIDRSGKPSKIQIKSDSQETMPGTMDEEQVEEPEKPNYFFEMSTFCRKCKSPLRIPQENYCQNCGYPA